VPEAGQDVIAVVHGMIELPTDQQALATPQVEGRVRRILVQPSQQVSAGDVLAEVDSLQLRSLQLDLLQTLAKARLIKQSLHRLDGLRGRTVVPQRAGLGVRERGADARIAGRDVQTAARLLGAGSGNNSNTGAGRLDGAPFGSPTRADRPVRAPTSGRIVSFNVVPGQVVHRDEALFEIHDLSRVWVKGYVFERDASRVQLKQAANVRFAAYPQLEASGTVVRISPTMDEKERVLPVWVEVANADHLLKDGMLARITLLAGPATDRAPGVVAALAPIGSVK